MLARKVITGPHLDRLNFAVRLRMAGLTTRMFNERTTDFVLPSDSCCPCPMGRFCVIAHQFANVGTPVAACILAAVALAAPLVVQGQCQPVAGSNTSQASEPHSSSSG